MVAQATVIGYGGSYNKTADTPVTVSYWYVPGGADYVNAEVRQVFFTDVEKAKKFCDDYDPPPEMATIDLVNDQPYHFLK